MQAAADRIGPRRWVAIGMLASAAMAVLFQQLHTLTSWLIGASMLALLNRRRPL